VDLIANEDSRRTFLIRSKLIQAVRQFMDKNAYLEVETPMMHPIPGGAVARPFVTHHNSLDMTMYLRIAPELYLKRLVVGGFERVYEINRNFRNEGISTRHNPEFISTRHNPEFTMIEFYQAYADYNDLMTLTEQLLQFICDSVLGNRHIEYQGQVIDFNQPFARMSVKEAILKYHPNVPAAQLENIEGCRSLLDALKLEYKPSYGLGKLQMIAFEETVEHQLFQPTFITAYPTEISPLARLSFGKTK